MGMTSEDRREMRECITQAIEPLCDRIDELKAEVRQDAGKTQELSEHVSAVRTQIEEKSKASDQVFKGLGARIGKCEGVIRWVAFTVVGAVLAALLSLVVVGAKAGP